MKKKLIFTMYVIAFILITLAGGGFENNNIVLETDATVEVQDVVENYADFLKKDIEFEADFEVIYSEEVAGTKISLMASVADNATRMSYELNGNGFDIYCTSKRIYMNTLKNYESNWVYAGIYDENDAEELLELYKKPIILEAGMLSYLGYVGEKVENNIVYDVVEFAYEDVDEEGNPDKYKGYCYIIRSTKEIHEIKLKNIEKGTDFCIRSIKSIKMPSEAIGAEKVDFETVRMHMLDVMADDFLGLNETQNNEFEKEEKLTPYKEYFYSNNIFPEIRHISVEGKSYKVPYKLEFADDEIKHMEKYYFGDTFIEFYVIGDLTYLHINKVRNEDKWYFMHDTNGESTKDIRKYLFETLVFSNTYIEVITYNEQLSSEDYDVLRLDLSIGESGSSSLVWVNKAKGHIEKISTDYGYEEQRIMVNDKVFIELPKQAELAEELDAEKMIEVYKDSITMGIYDLLSNTRYIE